MLVHAAADGQRVALVDEHRVDRAIGSQRGSSRTLAIRVVAALLLKDHPIGDDGILPPGSHG